MSLRPHHALLAIASATATAAGGCTDSPGFEPLFDGRSLAGWYSWLPSQGRDADPHGVFSVHDEMIHMLPVDLTPAQFEFGYLATEREYERFHARFEYRWGERKYVSFPRDSGFFIHVVGEDRIWPRAFECQVMENDTGSVYLFEHATVSTTIDPARPDPTYLDGGAPYTSPRVAAPFPRITHAAPHDSLTDWNQVEVIVDADGVQLRVNGEVTFRGHDLTQPDPAQVDDASRDRPLARGRLLLQQEGAEVMFRNLELQTLD